MKFILALLLLTVAGCSSASARKVMPLDHFQRIYVESRLNDNEHLDELFVAELRKFGREASSGPSTMMPENTDAVLTYTPRWQWDFKTYLIELNLELYSVHPHKKLADARYYQPSIKTKPPAEAIHEMLERLMR